MNIYEIIFDFDQQYTDYCQFCLFSVYFAQDRKFPISTTKSSSAC